MDGIFEELGIPNKHLKPTNRDDKFVVTVHQSWLKSLVKCSKLSEYEPCDEDTGCKVFIKVYKKRADVKVIPLPCIRNTVPNNNAPLLFVQLMQYVNLSNYKNLWKKAYKQYGPKAEGAKETQVTLVDHDVVLREIIVRIYGCPIVNVCEPPEKTPHGSSGVGQVNLNILPALCAVETLNAMFVIHSPFMEHNLRDCVNFSPALLEKCRTKPLFVVYQILQTLKALHDSSLTMGEISLDEIYLTEDMWIYVVPALGSNIYVQDPPKLETKKLTVVPDCRKVGHKFGYNLKCEFCGIRTYDKVQVSQHQNHHQNLDALCQLWIDGQISNFTYISALNRLSGRKLGDPNCHHVFPWVTDFTSRCGKTWRDLKKSKFRLNKGDRQLDLTYENSEVPHHVSDVLSAITYYVYMARRTSKSVLCKNVRTVWVPAEYPSSIQRMQEWTPDECIPELFTDPTVFRSIHDDLDDLEVPVWCSGPEDFIERHREALESQHVSERLHHWIDLTFGYKLAGNAAIKSKNVCLHLVDGHSKLMKSGIVQLFTHPHPQKQAATSLFWGKSPPKLYQKSNRQKSRNRSNSPAVVSLLTVTKSDDEDAPPGGVDDSMASPSLAFSKFLSRSRSSLNGASADDPRRGQRSASLGPKNPSFTSHVKPKSLAVTTTTTSSSSTMATATPTGCVPLPKDYRPEQALDVLEKKHAFFTKTFRSEEAKRLVHLSQDVTSCKREELDDDDFVVQNAFTNLIFAENFEHKQRFHRKSHTFPQDCHHQYHHHNNNKHTKALDNQIVCNYAEIISSRRIRELQILGCLIVEVFMAKELRALGGNENLTLHERLKACLTIVTSGEVPKCVECVVKLLLQPDKIEEGWQYPAITDRGLPPPSAHLLLEPLLDSIVPFPKLFPKLYGLVALLKDFKNVSLELDVLYHFDCDGTMCDEYASLEKAKILFVQNIGECKVKACVQALEDLLKHVNCTTDSEIVDILLPHVKELIEDPPTSVLAAWYLFDPIARVLGPVKTGDNLLESILKLYENEPNDNLYNGKIAKLYHHSFLLRLIVRLGLKSFLENFITPLVEAVGRYKDFEPADFTLHTHSEKASSKKTSHLKTMEDHNSMSTSDGSTSSSERKTLIQDHQQQEDIFEFEDDKSSDEQQQLKSLIEQLELNVAASSDLPQAEEALDATLNENIDQMRNLEELTINLSEDEDQMKRSPSLDEPSGSSQKATTTSSGTGSVKSQQSGGTTGNNSNKKQQDNNAKISDMSSDSLVWLSHRLGPVLTARYLSRNLLKMLTLCYVGRENLSFVRQFDEQQQQQGTADHLSVVSSHVVGDQNAVKVLECLSSIAGLYGEQFILFQYIPHMSELIALCKRKLTANLEGALISCLALLKHIIPYLSDSTLMDQLQDVILKNILHPSVRLLGSTKYNFPNGHVARNVLARKYVDTLYVLSIRMGSDMTRTHLAVPALQRFFLIFDKVHASDSIQYPEQQITKEQEESNYVELTRDGTAIEWVVSGNSGQPLQISHAHLKSALCDSPSPPLNVQLASSIGDEVNQALDELAAVFTAELAYEAYLPFVRHIGLESLDISLKNHETIKVLCQRFEHPVVISPKTPMDLGGGGTTTKPISSSSSIGSNIALVVGNRIDVQETSDGCLLSLVSNRMENNSRHLRGNWLAYWEHEIGRADKDTMFNFKQIKLQTFQGHTNSVKCLYVLDNENSFMSGSRDKTVKLWSMRSQGDGSSVSQCQWTYTAHKKSVLSLTFVDSMRLAASCDSVVHIWDPFMGVNVGHLEAARYAPVNVLRSMPAPSSSFFAATTDCTVKVVDARLCAYVYELKVSLNPTGLIRCLAVAPSGTWLATGQSSGTVSVLDCRTGLIISTWKAHEGEVLQLVALDNETLISSSLDQTVSVWNVADGKLKFPVRGATEPVHCLSVYNNELISGTTANRIGVHTSIDLEASFSSTKLRSDAFRGLLTSMAVLPLNRLLLLGADTGNVNLLC